MKVKPKTLWKILGEKDTLNIKTVNKTWNWWKKEW